MPGTYTFKPIEATLLRTTNGSKMNPYCSFNINGSKVKGKVCKKGGKFPHWNDLIVVPANIDESEISVEVMDKDKLGRDDTIGSLVLDLHEVQSRKQMKKWYPLYYDKKPAGEVLMELVFEPEVIKISTLIKTEQYQTTKGDTVTVLTKEKVGTGPGREEKYMSISEIIPVNKQIGMAESR